MRQTRLQAAARADRASSGADVAADSDVATHRERADSVVAVEDDDKVCDVRADLQAPAEAAGCDAGRGRPRSVWEARDDEA